jgi:hypothetical protein
LPRRCPAGVRRTAVLRAFAAQDAAAAVATRDLLALVPPLAPTMAQSQLAIAKRSERAAVADAAHYVQCQRAGWDARHKVECKLLRAEREAAGAAGGGVPGSQF